MGWGGASVRERNGDGGYGYGCGASGSKAEENSAGQEAFPLPLIYISLLPFSEFPSPRSGPGRAFP